MIGRIGKAVRAGISERQGRGLIQSGELEHIKISSRLTVSVDCDDETGE